ncbi:hypothetical protein ACHQM5_007559 [Ranunculus cassubicifolius]
MCTAHYVDQDWKLTKKILNFFVVPNHKGETIGMMLEKSLISWGIDRFLTVTCDNASSNNTAIASLKLRTNHWENVLLHLEFVQVRCSAHILNLVVRCGLDEFDESINRVRDVVRYVRSSAERWAKWKKWNSTYMMLERAETFERAFARMGADDEEFKKFFVEVNVEEEDEAEILPPPITKKKKAKEKRKQVTPKGKDWGRVRLFVQFLELYYKTTNKIPGSNYFTSDLLFNELVMIHGNLKKLCNSLDDGLSQIGLKNVCKV